MIQVDDKNKFHMTGDDLVKESTRISVALIELTRKLNEFEPKIALSFLRVVHTMTNGLAKPIVEQMDKEAEARLKGKMKEKREEKKRRKALIAEKMKESEEKLNGDTEQCDTTSGNTADTSESDGIRSDDDTNSTGSDNS